MVTPTTDEYHEDALGNLLTRTTQNFFDVSSQYQFSGERVRLFRNDTRQFPQYGSVTGFTDSAKTWDLTPGGGNSMRVETAESNSYIVGYEVIATFAMQVSQSLQSGDTIQVGLRKDNNGLFLEQRGSDHTDTQVDVIQLDGGTRTTLATDVELAKPVTDATRFVCRFTWYGVGSMTWSQTHTEDGEQINNRLVETAEDGVFSPETGNFNLRYDVSAGTGSSGLTYRVGSSSLKVAGDVQQLTRSKPQLVTVDLPATDDTWLPVYAMSLDGTVPNVNASFRGLDILRYGNNVVLELVVVSFHNTKTSISESDFGEPDYHHTQHSGMEEARAGTDSVFDVADDSGTVKTLTSSDKFGGYTVASASITSDGNTVSTSDTQTQVTDVQRQMLDSDHLVFLARTSNAGASLSFVWTVEQSW